MDAVTSTKSARAEQHLERKHKLMMILPKKPSYDLPEGCYRATLREVFELRQTVKGREEKVYRLVFQITSLRHPRLTYLAGKNYRASNAAKLGEDMDAWLGEEFDRLVDADGTLALGKLESLQGRDADIEVVLIDNDSYDTAFRHVQRILPPGTLVDDRQPPRAAA